MRASTLSLLVAAALAGHASPLLAQTSASDKSSQVAPAAPGTEPGDPKTKGDDALSPSTLPKARQNVKESGTNHIDELSPDEARRLERLRAKAASKPQPATAKPAASEKAVLEQAAGKPSPAADPDAKTPAPPKEATQAPTRRNAKEAGANHIDELSADEARRLERLRAKAAASKPRPEEAAKTAPEQAAKAPNPPGPAADPDAKPPAPPKEAAQAPAADTKPPAAAGAAEKAPQARAARHAARRAHRPSRDLADDDLDGRRPSRRQYAPSRRDGPEVAERAPRIGDVVPPDVPLFPMGPRARPPFPRGDDDDDGPPRRRVFMGPW